MKEEWEKYYNSIYLVDCNKNIEKIIEWMERIQFIFDLFLAQSTKCGPPSIQPNLFSLRMRKEKGWMRWAEKPPKGMNEFALVASLFCGLRAAAAALLRKEEKTATNKANGFTSRGEKTAATKPPNSISLIIKEMRVGVELVCWIVFFFLARRAWASLFSSAVLNCLWVG